MNSARLARVGLALLGAALASGTVGAQTEYSKVAALIGPGRVSVLVQAPQTKFAARIPKQQAGAALLAPLLGGAVAAAKAGEAMRKEHGIVDPVEHFRDAFLAELAEQRPIDAEMIPGTASEDPSILGKGLATELALDFKTVVWTLAVNGDQHRIEYWGRARLIRLDSGKVLWKETCKFRTADPEATRHTLEDLLRDDAALLNQEFSAATSDCAAKLASP